MRQKVFFKSFMTDVETHHTMFMLQTRTAKSPRLVNPKADQKTKYKKIKWEEEKSNAKNKIMQKYNNQN